MGPKLFCSRTRIIMLLLITAIFVRFAGTQKATGAPAAPSPAPPPAPAPAQPPTRAPATAAPAPATAAQAPATAAPAASTGASPPASIGTPPAAPTTGIPSAPTGTPPAPIETPPASAASTGAPPAPAATQATSLSPQPSLSRYSPPSVDNSSKPMPAPPPANPPKLTVARHYTSTANVCSDNPNCKTDTKQGSGKTVTSEDHDSHITTIIPSGYDSATITAFVTKIVTVTVTVYVPGYTTTLTENGIPYETYYPPSTMIIMQTVTSVAPVGFEFVDADSKARRLDHYEMAMVNHDHSLLVSLAY
ncbi:15200_t:CDS:2 [Cetraspora pellucida]|uniref:15200_t:CDS:1 n=1 Tax=Cetraspora pellucida TaxID=1433469 RepID=A0ACA9KS26_9GLOM|nr:15200_t:CDS:2 [Cetraspora pellucida]